MRGCVTERDFDLAEANFPGIRQFYAALDTKPDTFLELLWLYLQSPESPARPEATEDSADPASPAQPTAIAG